MRRDRHGEDTAWPAVLSPVLLSGAVAAAVAAGMLRIGAPEAAPIASVRLGNMTAAYAARAAAEGATAKDVRASGEALETALDQVARRRGEALLPAVLAQREMAPVGEKS